MGTFAACQRLWWYEGPGGRKPPQTADAAGGEDIHAQVEGTRPPTHPSAVLARGLFLPGGTFEVKLVVPANPRTGMPRLAMRVDWHKLEGTHLHLRDLKTKDTLVKARKDPRWYGGEQLRNDRQLLWYLRWLPNWETATASVVFAARSEKSPGAQMVPPCRFKRPDVMDWWERQEVPLILAAERLRVLPEEAVPRTGVENGQCQKYGGCPHFVYCDPEAKMLTRLAQEQHAKDATEKNQHIPRSEPPAAGPLPMNTQPPPAVHGAEQEPATMTNTTVNPAEKPARYDADTGLIIVAVEPSQLREYLTRHTTLIPWATAALECLPASTPEIEVTPVKGRFLATAEGRDETAYGATEEEARANLVAAINAATLPRKGRKASPAAAAVGSAPAQTPPTPPTPPAAPAAAVASKQDAAPSGANFLLVPGVLVPLDGEKAKDPDGNWVPLPAESTMSRRVAAHMFADGGQVFVGPEQVPAVLKRATDGQGWVFTAGGAHWPEKGTLTECVAAFLKTWAKREAAIAKEKAQMASGSNGANGKSAKDKLDEMMNGAL